MSKVGGWIRVHRNPDSPQVLLR